MNKHTFGISDPFAYAGKIERELARLEQFRGKRINDEIDAALNFSFTAWHLVDWLWKFPATQQILKSRGHSRFQEYHTYVRSQCPELQICYELALGLKHFEIHEDQRKVVKSATKTSGGGLARPLVRPLVRPLARPLVSGGPPKLVVTKNDGSRVPFPYVAARAAAFWRLELASITP